ncbi:MAG: cell division protein FtsZ [Gallionella sp.]|nr:cell division protein FtsZ [Gallionella sp.]MDD4959527.1 cell division protein FtsZ [Gallionella sp.]
MFEIMESQSQDAVIKVIGVGGCGGNAVDHMIEQGMQGVEFIVINTDAQALRRSKATIQLQIGANITKGLGAGARPSVGQAAAEEDRDRIKEMVMGANMVFITAGMGGGTGTGAAPIVAQIAKELNILTVAVVTKPFAYEGNRMRYAKAGIEALTEHVDSLIVVPNSKLMEVLGRDVTLPEAFKAANGVLQGAVAGIAEVINVPGLINVDFADVRTVMSENGMAMMGSGVASGPDRARDAAEKAIASPLLEDVDMSGARGVLVNITSSSNLRLKEVDDVMECVQFAAEEATVIIGSVFDESMGDDLRVTVVATGLSPSALTKHPKGEASTHHAPHAHHAPHHASAPAPQQPVRAAEPPPVTNRLETPTAFRTGRREQIEAMEKAGMETLDIPSFLRKQTD